MANPFHEEELLEVLDEVGSDEPRDLLVFNDDYNTFDHVIQTLIKVCRHTPEQAEQCTWIVHHRGKCCVKKGTFNKLRPMKDAICDAGIDAKVL